MTTPETPLYDLGQDRPGPRIGFYLSPILAVVGMTVLLVWAVTEWVAWQFGFHPNLGAPLIPPSSGALLVVLAVVTLCTALVVVSTAAGSLRRTSGPLFALAAALVGAAFVPVYAPWSVFTWAWRFGDARNAEPVFSAAWQLIVYPAHFLFVVAMFVSWRRARRDRRLSDSHGSARWATSEEVERSGLLGGDGVFLGLYKHSASDKGTYLRHNGPQHVLGFAPTRSGKGAGWVIPTLLTWRDSVLVHDIKGENWARTAGWRASNLGNRVLKFDPTCSDGSGLRYNPLLEVRRGPLEIRDAQHIADMLVDPDGRGAKDHWDLTAEEVLVAAILHVLYVGRNKTLRGCLELLTDASTDISNVLSRMKRSVHDPGGKYHWRDPITDEPTRTHPVVASLAQSLLNKSDNERSSVISSAVKFLALFRDDIVASNTSACDFTISDLVSGTQPTSVYLVVPPSDVTRTRVLTRLLINFIGRRVTETLTPAEDHGGLERRKLLLMMDEFPTLGRLDFFQTQLAYLAGYGIKAFLIVQDLSQLYAAYGTNESIVSNCHVRVAYAPNKVETAQLLSTMAGLMTIRKNRRMYSGNRLAPWLSHVMESEEESQRALMTPDEVMRLPDTNSLVFVAGARPIWAHKARYFEDRRLLERTEKAPPARCQPITDEPIQWDYVEPTAAESGEASGEATAEPTHERATTSDGSDQASPTDTDNPHDPLASLL